MLILYLFTKAKNLLHRLVLRRFGFGNRVPKAIWEKQFRKGAWDYLESQDEALHYQAIISLYQKQKVKTSILDIGCGQGILYNYFKKNTSSQTDYTGIDLSETAVKLAQERYPGINCKQADFENESLVEKFDIIIFNESLYYFPRPVAILEKCFSQNLHQNGAIIISMFDFPGHDEIWKKIEKQFPVRMQENVENGKCEKWKIKVVKKIPPYF